MRILRLAVIGLVGAWVLVQAWALAGELSGGHPGAAVLVLVLLGLVLRIVMRRWERVAPWRWWPLFGAAATGARAAVTWRATCEGLGLAVPAKRLSTYGLLHGGTSGSSGSALGSRRGGRGRGRRGDGLVVRGEPLRLVAPRRVRVRVDGCGLAVTVRMHPGQVPGQYERAGEGFAHAWRVHRVRVDSPRPGFVRLRGLGFDPLRHPRPTPSPSLTRVGRALAVRDRARGRGHRSSDGGRAAGVLSVAVGTCEDGSAWVMDLRRRPHHLVTGATQSGKSTLTARMVAELAPRGVTLVGIDAKNGMELAPFAPRLSALATSRGEAAAALEALVGVLFLRTMTCREHGARSIWELPEQVRPQPVVVVVDEVAELFLSVDKRGKEQAHLAVTSMVRIGQLGAALGVHLWVCGQRFGSDLGASATLLRAQLAGRVCHRVTDAETAAMTLDGLPREAVVEAQRIGTDLQGVAVIGDDTGAWFVARSHPLSLAQAGDVAARHSGLAVPLPEVTTAIENARVNGGGW